MLEDEDCPCDDEHCPCDGCEESDMWECMCCSRYAYWVGDESFNRMDI